MRWLKAGPVVAVVPGADLVTVQPGQFRREDPVQIGLGVAADGGIVGRYGDIEQVIQSGEQADLTELGDPGEEGEADVGV